MSIVAACVHAYTNASRLGETRGKAVFAGRSVRFIGELVLQENVVAADAVDRRRCPRFEQRRLGSDRRHLDRRRFPLPLAQEQAPSSSQEQERAQGAGETAQEASS